MKAVSPRVPRKFVPESELNLPESERFSAMLKGLTLDDEDVIKESLFIQETDEKGEIKFAAKMARQRRFALHVGLMSVSNLVDESGAQIAIARESTPSEFGIHKITNESLQAIPASIRDEIANEIIQSMQPTKADRKN